VRKNGGLIGNNFQTEVDANPKTTCRKLSLISAFIVSTQ